MGKPDSALESYQKALALQPSSTTLNNAIGDVYLAKGDLKSAGKYFQQALSENAHDPIAANNLAWVYAQQGDNLDMALSLATQAKQMAPEMNAVNDTLAWIQYKKGNYKVSVSFAEDAVRRAPENPHFRYHLGMALTGAGDKDRARTELQKALSLNLKGPDAAGRAEDPGVAQVVRCKQTFWDNTGGLTKVRPFVFRGATAVIGLRASRGRHEARRAALCGKGELCIGFRLPLHSDRARRSKTRHHVTRTTNYLAKGFIAVVRCSGYLQGYFPVFLLIRFTSRRVEAVLSFLPACLIALIFSGSER